MKFDEFARGLQKATVMGQLWTAWSATRSLLRDLIKRQIAQGEALKRIESEEIVIEAKLNDLLEEVEELKHGEVERETKEGSPLLHFRRPRPKFPHSRQEPRQSGAESDRTRTG